ncbi:hypothetical protein EYF80_037051 [Liparis tanakae]|uniref:Uncharacterized protein n=1 Tax=Liparis tanakae TaxID=230148 RepID=A0A4Z2GGS6_9TELE|nr:hypothetical protein EYF80_037051 [Liparis tanakae]
MTHDKRAAPPGSRRGASESPFCSDRIAPRAKVNTPRGSRDSSPIIGIKGERAEQRLHSAGADGTSRRVPLLKGLDGERPRGPDTKPASAPTSGCRQMDGPWTLVPVVIGGRTPLARFPLLTTISAVKMKGVAATPGAFAAAPALQTILA